MKPSYFCTENFDQALARAKGGYMAIGAHQDDLEIFAIHGIGKARETGKNDFVGVTVTDGGGSPRKGPFEQYTDQDMIEERLHEQNKAAEIGGYALQYQLGYESAALKGKEPTRGKEVINTLKDLIMAIEPKVIYTHNPFDKHESHNAITRAVVMALKAVPDSKRPEEFYGCEVWRGLDWLPDDMKVALDVSNYLDLQKKLIAAHKSQTSGGKNYVEGAIGREIANATFLSSHVLLDAEAATYAVDMMPLVNDKALSLKDYMQPYLDAFNKEILDSANTYG